jgi:pimeloyl-ACP methyl ester carboxylesterase
VYSKIDPTKIQVPVSMPGMDRTPVDTAHLPGIVIFVHGVNSDGEWFESSEKGLIAGLNRRMGLDRARATDAQLRPVCYAAELMADGRLNRQLSGDNFITDEGRSPVIRFRWGYKASGSDGTKEAIDEKAEYGGRIYLNELDAWGGGPFQNGTSALPYMWGDGLDDRVFWWLYANMFPVDGREVYASPPRAYFVHAAHRLTELIKAIRSKQADCPITVVCHSQGNMVTLAAALMGESEGAIADTYVLCNPPYSLESLTMDQMVNHDSRGATGDFGGITKFARQETFKNFLSAVKQRATGGQSLDLINRYHAFVDPATGEDGFKLGAFPSADAIKLTPPKGQDRDNRGRVFLYCNPHDQVIGVTPVQGIGWKGVDQAQLDRIGAAGVFYQRVWAHSGGPQTPAFAVGDPDWTGRAYRYIEDHHAPGSFWNPPAPRMKFRLSFNDSQGFFSKIFTLAASPLVYIVTHAITLRINDEPAKSWAVPITAPVLPEPVRPASLRYGVVSGFDEGKDPARDALATADATGKLNDAVHGGAYKGSGLGDWQSEAGLRYEHRARLQRERLERQRRGVEFSEGDQRESVRKMLEENPNATDHSTILANPKHSEKVLAYDVAVGWVNPSKITAEDMMAFRQFAHWMFLEAAKTRLGMASRFMEYQEKGWYLGQQVHRFYNVAHMRSFKISDQREQHLLGRLKG